jgi:MFS family permease
MTVTATPTTAVRRSPLTDGRLALVAGLTLLAILAIGLAPTILREQTRDWIAYEQAADRLAAGEPLYVFELATPEDEYYLYPPPTAAIWSAVGSPEGLLVVKVLALVGVGALMVVVAPGASRRNRWIAFAALAAAALIAAPDLHDLVLGNVMALYVGAVAVSVARPGWLGSGFLGAVCAVALKPAIGPYLVWLAIRRPRDAVRTLAVGLAVSAVFAVLVGPGRYVEYLVALPRMSVLVGLPSGNVGLAAVSPALAIAGVVFAYVATVWAGLRLDLGRGAAVAVAACLLAQPSIGFNYAGLLIPAVVALWSADRAAGFVAILAAPIVAVVSPPAASVVVIALAAARLGERLGLDPDRAAAPAPAPAPAPPPPPAAVTSARPG